MNKDQNKLIIESHPVPPEWRALAGDAGSTPPGSVL
jgi:hypothetical protein